MEIYPQNIDGVTLRVENFQVKLCDVYVYFSHQWALENIVVFGFIDGVKFLKKNIDDGMVGWRFTHKISMGLH